ncbi:hypothetical protein B0H11DRAFT_437894 [Mycena galericulata]|nr:hypothetical protein B0H11DRAFT_437894 [Mycena galericulata]
MSLWNFTIQDTSPILSYLPYADGSDESKGWQAWYTTSGFNTQVGESPVGDSYHVTSLPGANVTLQFYGTAVYLYGSANASYDVTLDNTVHSFSPFNGLLYSNDGLIAENHFVTLTAKPSNESQLMAFGYAIVSTVDQSVPKETFYDNSNSALTYFGQWENPNPTIDGIPSSTVTVPFHQTLDAGSGVTMGFPNSVAVALYASTNFGHELYSVSIDNGSPQIYNASTNWLVANTVIFFQSGLNPDETHTIYATNISPGGAAFSLSSVITYQLDASPTISGSSSNTAAATDTARLSSNPITEIEGLVGEIVGPILGFILIVLVPTFFWLRSQRTLMKDYMRTISHLVLDPRSPFEETTGTSSDIIETALTPPRRHTRRVGRHNHARGGTFSRDSAHSRHSIPLPPPHTMVPEPQMDFEADALGFRHGYGAPSRPLSRPPSRPPTVYIEADAPRSSRSHSAPSQPPGCPPQLAEPRSESPDAASPERVEMIETALPPEFVPLDRAI